MATKILIIGACGQIGTELTIRLREIYGNDNVIAGDIREGSEELMQSGPFEIVDAMNRTSIEDVCLHYEINEVYLMAAMLSATAEKYPKKAWNLNMDSLFHILNIAKEGKIDKIFWPSSIAVFGPTTPKENTPQQTVMEPSTVYGISKQTGERWCEYYYNKYGVDVRSIRYPGLISWKTLPGGGTTDYAVEIFHEALKNNHYDCFLKEDTSLPMMFMEDAIKATVSIMQTKSENIKQRSSYNLAGMTFTPAEIASEITKHLPDFTVTYQPDFRQSIADSWPGSIDDSVAREDWSWSHDYDLEKMVKEMLDNLK
ncbi:MULTISPECIES: NAD-dependent epimerase/dehydratase family protein [Nonlabens]|uniref:NAD-dependent epimerase n=2 Tax=Nonlabens ulvanivorans TaxID=906888 RepID=A0A084JT86_NONUL|nr:NAD-dependent epimerase/dehydratase family protein [Nonlabens ulvanivorans]KEZ92170.1 NAD-dependent epimerase [Nonlabens ulvanivorans]PRX14998.1 nucleoside-diphosphate-sugar epimerase [Nonlabens ulvanivorans]WOI22639.1 NAD-dependent epimerase/dehydratase family protein [Nonlabens ulvanivorans]GAL74298.1 UDP-glucose 4-epimerase related protein [Nonlabens ulvanivorans]